MRINSIDNNSPRFKALKIHDNVKPLLEKESLEYIQTLKQLGVRLKDFKHIDLVYKDNLVPKIYNAHSKLENPLDFYKELLREENCLGKIITLGEKSDSFVGVYPKQPYSFIDIYGSELAVSKYEEFKKLKPEDKLVEFCRMLNEKEEKRIEKALTEKLAKEQNRVAVKKELVSLYESYGPECEKVSFNKQVQSQGIMAKIKSIFKK